MDTFDKMLLIQNITQILKTHNINVNWPKVLATDLLKRDPLLAKREEMILPSNITSEMKVNQPDTSMFVDLASQSVQCRLSVRLQTTDYPVLRPGKL